MDVFVEVIVLLSLFASNEVGLHHFAKWFLTSNVFWTFSQLPLLSRVSVVLGLPNPSLLDASSPARLCVDINRLVPCTAIVFFSSISPSFIGYSSGPTDVVCCFPPFSVFSRLSPRLATTPL